MTPNDALRRTGLAVLASGFLLGCSLHSRVVHLPNNAYQVSVVATEQGGIDRARRSALRDANAHCNSLRKRIWIVSEDTAPNVATVTFTCD
jgi:hypothetical protein